MSRALSSLPSCRRVLSHARSASKTKLSLLKLMMEPRDRPPTGGDEPPSKIQRTNAQPPVPSEQQLILFGDLSQVRQLAFNQRENLDSLQRKVQQLESDLSASKSDLATYEARLKSDRETHEADLLQKSREKTELQQTLVELLTRQDDADQASPGTVINRFLNVALEPGLAPSSSSSEDEDSKERDPDYKDE
jgi:hypothetical protein